MAMIHAVLEDAVHWKLDLRLGVGCKLRLKFVDFADRLTRGVGTVMVTFFAA